MRPVHPRGCGEQAPNLQAGDIAIGSSPRARGTVLNGEARELDSRFIPAGAGNSIKHGPSLNQRSVHPRGRGEQLMAHDRLDPERGSSPRARGTGLHRRIFLDPQRFIPAGAGNSAGPSSSTPAPPVHPRGRGEQICCSLVTVSPTGSSPRARGTGKPSGGQYDQPRFIPAGAGNSLNESTAA